MSDTRDRHLAIPELRAVDLSSRRGHSAVSCSAQVQIRVTWDEPWGGWHLRWSKERLDFARISRKHHSFSFNNTCKQNVLFPRLPEIPNLITTGHLAALEPSIWTVFKVTYYIFLWDKLSMSPTLCLSACQPCPSASGVLEFERDTATPKSQGTTFCIAGTRG